MRRFNWSFKTQKILRGGRAKRKALPGQLFYYTTTYTAYRADIFSLLAFSTTSPAQSLPKTCRWQAFSSPTYYSVRPTPTRMR